MIQTTLKTITSFCCCFFWFFCFLFNRQITCLLLYAILYGKLKWQAPKPITCATHIRSTMDNARANSFTHVFSHVHIFFLFLSIYVLFLFFPNDFTTIMSRMCNKTEPLTSIDLKIERKKQESQFCMFCLFCVCIKFKCICSDSTYN